MDDRELDLDALEKVARAATQKPWFRSGGRNDLYDGNRPLNGHGICLEGEKQDTIAHVFFDKRTGDGFSDANHIAAFSPPTVLKLIALARPKAGGVEDGEATRGWVTWLSSGEDEGPDCGIMLGLGGGKVLLAGELAKITVEASGVDSARFPDEWWIAVRHATETEVIAAVADQDAARNFIEMIAKALAPAPEPLRVAEHKCFECTSELSGPICLTCNPLASSVRVAGEEVERLQDAIEGECDGLAITEAQAKAILDHVALIEPSAGKFLADLDAAFEVEIEKVSTLAMNSNTIAREFYRRLRARVYPTPDQPKQEVKEEQGLMADLSKTNRPGVDVGPLPHAIMMPAVRDWRRLEDGAPTDGFALFWPCADGIPGVWAVETYHQAMRPNPPPYMLHLARDAVCFTHFASIVTPEETQGGFSPPECLQQPMGAQADPADSAPSPSDAQSVRPDGGEG